MSLGEVKCPKCNGTRVQNVEIVGAYREVLGQSNGKLLVDVRETPAYDDGDGGSQMVCTNCSAKWDFGEDVFYIGDDETLKELEA